MNTERYELATKAFKGQRYQESLQQIEQFKKENSIETMLDLSYEYAFFEMLVNYHLGLKGDKPHFKVVTALGESYLALNRIDMAKSSELLKQQSFTILTLMGESFSHLANLGSAIKAFEYAVKLDPDKKNRVIWFKLFVMYAKCMKSVAARELAGELSSWQEFTVPILFCLLDLSILEQNRRSALKEIQLIKEKFDLLDEEHLYRFIDKVVYISEFDMAEELIHRASKGKGLNISFSLWLAAISFSRKEYGKVIEIIEQAGQTDSRKGAHLLGRAYEKLGEFDKAFRAYSLSAQHQESDARSLLKTDQDKNFTELYKHINLADLHQKNVNHKGDDKVSLNTPVFLIGFPRSGTTLLDTILDTQSGLEILSERPAVLSVCDYMETVLGKRYPQDIVTLSATELDELRNIYFETVKQYSLSDTRGEVGVPIIVDKMPLNTLHIPIILSLFPDAKFIFSVRHPMDCVLSNFQQNFKYSHEISFLSTLDSCTERYRDVLSHFERCEQEYDLDVHFVKYENLVLNFEEEAKKVFEFIGLKEVDDAYLEFNRKAEDKIVNTASKDQVTQAMYLSSTYKWKNYDKHLSVQLKTLDYFIEKFGYLA